MDAIASGTISLAGNIMCKVQTVSDFNHNAKQSNDLDPLDSVGWNTLEDLHATAMAGGCTKAQFAEAVETVGTNPSNVANYLQRYALTWNVPKRKTTLNIHRRGR
jgi:Protein of unknown function (DUF3606)